MATLLTDGWKSRVLPSVREFVDAACDMDPYLSDMRDKLSRDEYQEFRSHFSGVLLAFLRTTIEEMEEEHAMLSGSDDER